MKTVSTHSAHPIIAFNAEGELTTPVECGGLTKLELFSKDILCAIIIADGSKGSSYDHKDPEKAVGIAKQLIDSLNKK